MIEAKCLRLTSTQRASLNLIVRVGRCREITGANAN
jgi:hypothetical protein